MKEKIAEQKIKEIRQEAVNKELEVLHDFLKSQLNSTIDFQNFTEDADIYSCQCELIEVGSPSSRVQVINPDGSKYDGYKDKEIVEVHNTKIWKAIINQGVGIVAFE